MRAALSLAARGLGNVWPNPAVGCLIVKDGRIVGRGWTRPGGRPHAEAKALSEAGAAARGACAYVTLEPCAHYGETPPCCDALIEAGIGRIVVAADDPDVRVSGRGLAAIRDSGIELAVGACAAAAEELNAGFLLHRRLGRPLVTLKLATTLDGRIATRRGDSKWITGELARARGHLLRSRHDAILVGSGTVVADDPMLTCRLPGYDGRQPVRVVADGRLRTPADGRLARSAGDVPVWIFAAGEGDDSPLRAAGCDVIRVVAGGNRGVLVESILNELAKRGITRLLVEGGGKLAASLLAADLVDRIVWFRAPSLAGGDGLPGIAGLPVDTVDQLHRFRRTAVQPIGDDVLESYARPA